MQLEYKWIRFEEVSDKHPSRKTRTFCCYNKSNVLLGTVQWDSGWRGYTFVTFTEAYNELKFSKSCLDDISSFIGQLVEDEKYARRNEPSR